MNWLWLYWPLALGFVAVLMFALPEALAIRYGGPTFSRFMATVRDRPFGPVWIWLWGVLCGGLVVHFSSWCMYGQY
jgi:hypothetical protein